MRKYRIAWRSEFLGLVVRVRVCAGMLADGRAFAP